MKKIAGFFSRTWTYVGKKLGLGIRAKLITMFLVVKVIPVILLTIIAWQQISVLGNVLREMAVTDSSAALNDSATENIERMTTDTAQRVADFLYGRDDDILYLSQMEPTEENYRNFAENKLGRLIETGAWVLSEDGQSWVALDTGTNTAVGTGGTSTNSENNDMDGFNYREPDSFSHITVPLYDEITFVDLNGVEQIKVVTNATKVNYPLSEEKRDVSQRESTYIKAETYFDKLSELAPGEIYVSDVIGAYVGSNYIGMYTPENVETAAEARGYDIDYDPKAQAYSGMENPNGQRFEGIVRWATPVTDDAGRIIGYVTFALNHDHIMEFVDHLTPMNERYTELPSAYEGNYAFIWDYQCRSICHPRHHSIVGYDPETGDEQIPWLESSIYDAWQASGVEKWTDFIEGWPTFDGQSRSKTPAPALTKAGLVGLDGRYLNNAPQCTGWMDLTQDGGSGSFYILWSGLYKLTTAGAIPYYTGQYAPSEANNYSRRGFGFVAIGAGLEDFTRPAKETEEKLNEAISDNLSDTIKQLVLTSAIIIVLIVLIAIWIASGITGSITQLITGISRFRAGERQFRFHSTETDEFGTLADSFDEMADSIVDSVKNPLSITDMEGKILYMNDSGLAFCRMTLDEIVGTYYKDSSVYPTGTPYYPITALDEGREAETYYDENSGRYLKGTANYFLSKDGDKIGYIIESTDVTEMVRERNKIEEQRMLLDKMFSASPDPIWYMDSRGTYLTVNPRFAAIAGKSTEDFIGKNAREIFPDEIASVFEKNDLEALRSKTPLYSEERIPFADTHVEILESVRTTIYDTNGSLVGLLGFARNVTVRVTIANELRQTQLELEEAVDDANRANAHKGEFLARMSHEIRTPMNAIIGLTNIVLRKLDDADAPDEGFEEIKGHVRQIEVSSQHLLGLLNDILDISKIEAGKIELSEETMEITKLVGTVVGIIKPRCDEKNIRFVVNYDKFTPSTFIGDSLRLRQVLINLLGNSVKFTPELGRIELTVERIGRENGKTHICFSVRDTGIGMSEESQKTIFTPFEQGDRSISKQYGGTGLGLSISRRIVQLFGGDIMVRSRLGEGSEFAFDIWLTEAEAEAPEQKAITDVAGKYRGKRALLVDDVEINRVIVMNMLESTGMSIDEAADGKKALELFQNSAEDTYDIILMDVQMPVMDGYEASDAIRALERADAKRIPIITLTANAFQDDIDRAMRHGMNAHITKPVDMDRLVEVLLRFLEA